MKTNKLILLAAVATAALTLNSTARAQFKPETDDGITASPKLRQQLDERNTHRDTVYHLAVASTSVRSGSNVTASPKGAQQLAESGAPMKRGTAVADNTPSTTARPSDGTVASPKYRAQIDERGAQIQIAPVK